MENLQFTKYSQMCIILKIHLLLERAQSMRRRLFLTGPAETGKSEMIQKVLGDRIGQAGGFITVRGRDEKGNVRSYSLVAADGSGQQDKFLEIIGGKSVTHLEVFSQLGATLVQRAQNKPFAVRNCFSKMMENAVP